MSWTPQRWGNWGRMGARELPKWYDNNPLIPENNPYKVVDRAEQRLGAIGQEAPKRKNVGNLLMSALSYVGNASLSVITNPIKNLTDNDPSNATVGELLKSSLRGLTGKEYTTTTDLFDTWGWKAEANPQGKWYNPTTWKPGNVARGILGFVGDVALDPITYTGLKPLTGLGKAAGKGAAKAGLKDIAARGAKALGDDALNALVKFSGKSADDLVKMAARHGDDAAYILDLAKISYRKPESAMDVLNRGVKAVTTDFIKGNELLLKSTAGLQNIALKETLSGTKGIARTGGRVFGKDINRAIKGMGDKGMGVADSLIRTLDGSTIASGTLSNINRDLTKELIRTGGTYSDDAVRSILGRHISGADLNNINNLVDVLGGTRLAEGLGTMQARAMKSPQLAERLTGLLGDHKVIAEGLSKTTKQLEIAGQLSAAYDEGLKRLMLTFGGKPILELTPLAKHLGVDGTIKGFGKAGEPLYEGFMNRVMLGKGVVGESLRSVSDIFGGMFKPDHVSKNLLRTDPAAYRATKEVADNIVKTFLEQESKLPKDALHGAATLFASIPGFYEKPYLRTAATYFVENGIDDYTVAAWSYISGGALDAKASKYITRLASANPTKFKELTQLKRQLTPDDLNILKEVGAKVYMFNDAVLQFDRAYNIAFDTGSDVAEKLLEGYTPDELGRYVSRYYDFPTSSVGKPATSSTERISAKMSTYHKSFEKRKYTSTAHQILVDPSLNPRTDIIESMARRHYDSLRVRQNAMFRKSLEDAVDGGIEGMENVASRTAKRGMKKVENLGLYVSDELHRQLERVPEFIDKANRENWLLGVYDGLSNLLKRTQTSLNPGFILRNLIGETSTNLYWAGVTGRAHKEAANMMVDLGSKHVATVGDTVFHNSNPLIRRIISKDKPKLGIVEIYNARTKKWVKATSKLMDEADYQAVVTRVLKKRGVATYMVGGKEWTSLGLMQLFENEGLGWSGISKGNLQQNLQSTLQREVSRTKGGAMKKASRVYLDAGDTTETWTRFAHFVDRLEKGYTPKEAAKNVRMFHVDYRDLTPIERKAFKRIMPYYTYMRKNVPMQLRMLATQPGRASTLFHLIDNSYTALQQSQGGEEIPTQQYLKDGLALPLGLDGKGNVVYLNWSLPLSDISRLQYSMKGLLQENVLDMLNPLITSPMELNSNTNFSFGSPIQKYEGERAPILPNWEGSPKGLPKKADYLTQQFGVANTIRQALGTGASVLAGETPEPTRPRQIPMLQSLMPIRNQTHMRTAQEYEYRDQLLDYIQMLRDKGIYVPSYQDLQQRRFTP